MGGHSGGGGRAGRGGGGGLGQAISDLSTTDGLNEHLIALGPSGNKLFQVKGEYDNVFMTDTQMAQLTGGHIVHTHPSASALSLQDLYTAREKNLKSITAVSIKPDSNGKRWVYTAKPGKDGWPSEDRMWHADRSAFSEASKIVDHKIDSGKLPMSRFQGELRNEIMKIIARETGIKYTQRELK